MDNYYTASREFEEAVDRADCLARVAVHFSWPDAAGLPALQRALKDFLRTHKQEKPANSRHCTQEVYYWGGHSYILSWERSGSPQLTLVSAGQDAISSLEIAAQDLADALLDRVDQLQISYTELA